MLPPPTLTPPTPPPPASHPSPQKVAHTTKAALSWLQIRDHQMIFWDADPGEPRQGTYHPTPFGKAVLASGLPPEVRGAGTVCVWLDVGAPTPTPPLSPPPPAGKAALASGLLALTPPRHPSPPTS